MNPYLPLYEYIPDGEPHVYDGRIYLFGSHDRFDGEVFCQNNYVSYSADIKDPENWRYEGVIYCKEQDPRNEGLTGLDAHYMWAPDVVKGLDGRYYLYYCLDVLPEIAVAVCDTPAGKYEFLGYVKHKDGTPLGLKEGDLVQFDPGVYIDGNTIYMYSGNSPRTLAEMSEDHRSQVMTLEEDMLTLKTLPKRLMPMVGETEGTPYEGFEFFEASSIRKINNKYYFIYSDVQSNSLSYAISDYPDKDYQFGGHLIALGDTCFNGRTREDARNFLGNTHGSVECVNGEWYVFYHRQTNRNLYSRQSCVEHIHLNEDGTFTQPVMTSLGFRKEPLETKGSYNACYACHLWGERGVYEHVREKHDEEDYPYYTQSKPDCECDAGNYIANMHNGSVAGYKYFHFDKDVEIKCLYKGNGTGKLRIWLENDSTCDSLRMIKDLTDTNHPQCVCELDIEPSETVKWTKGMIKNMKGDYSLYIEYVGIERIDLFEVGFEND